MSFIPILTHIHHAGIEIDGLEVCVRLVHSRHDAVEGEMLATIGLVGLVHIDDTTSHRLIDLIIGCIAAAMVTNNQDVVLGRGSLLSPVDEACQRVRMCEVVATLVVSMHATGLYSGKALYIRVNYKAGRTIAPCVPEFFVFFVGLRSIFS
jgi:hypothetical protein